VVQRYGALWCNIYILSGGDRMAWGEYTAVESCHTCHCVRRRSSLRASLCSFVCCDLLCGRVWHTRATERRERERESLQRMKVPESGAWPAGSLSRQRLGHAGRLRSTRRAARRAPPLTGSGAHFN
jgi:hypothetical protein